MWGMYHHMRRFFVPMGMVWMSVRKFPARVYKYMCGVKTKRRTVVNYCPALSVCEYMKDYRTFKEDFFKIIDFCHYLHEEGYDLMKF